MNILIWGEIKRGGPYDIFRQLDYAQIFSELKSSYQATGINIGNKVWIQGLVSALSTPENKLFFLNKEETWDTINQKYDKIVFTAANLFSPYCKDLIAELASTFSNSRIPVYVVAVGAQADGYEGLQKLADSLKGELSRFMDVIYKTGGEIACRGYFTKQLLDKIGENSAVVTGCPSLFQNGRNLRICKRQEEIKPVFNGNMALDERRHKEFPHAVYIDQEDWIQATYDRDYCNDGSEQVLAKLLGDKDIYSVRMFLSGNIRVFYDMPEWHRFLIENEFNFSIGSRIHGNIMSLLSGIPAMVCAVDSRTREMAEFYHIPLYFPNDKIDIRKAYANVDYGEFHANFPRLFDRYEKFLQDCGLVKKVNEENIFWSRSMPQNTTAFSGIRAELSRKYDDMSHLRKVLLKAKEYGKEKLGLRDREIAEPIQSEK